MKEKRILTCLNEVNEQFISEAAPAKNQTKKLTWIKWCAAAASLVLFFALSAGILLQKFNAPSYTVTLDDGSQITFVPGDANVSNLDIALVGMRPLNKMESDVVFGDLNVDAYVGFEENTNEFIYLDGTINDMKIIVTRSDISPDVVLDGKEKLSNIRGIPVSTGYFLTEANSQGNQTAIVYASFEVGNYAIQLETSGPKVECNNLCNALAQTIDTMLESASLDFEQIEQ